MWQQAGTMDFTSDTCTSMWMLAHILISRQTEQEGEKRPDEEHHAHRHSARKENESHSKQRQLLLGEDEGPTG